MLYQKKMRHMRIDRRIYHTVLLAFVFLFIARLCLEQVAPVCNAGLLNRLSKQYLMGDVYDREGEKIAQGDLGTYKWTGTKEEASALSALFGPDIEETHASRMTLWGMMPELFGYSDQRLNLKGLMYPGKVRQGGKIRLTIEKELQTYIYGLLKKNGYDKASVVVSDWKSGEILAAVSTPPLSEEGEAAGNVFSERYSPGSTMKMVLTAAALKIDPSLKGFVYNCTPGNHIFHTEDGDYRINCAGGISHGTVGMKEAFQESCNGYFISLLQQIPKDVLKKELKNWGFDTVVSYQQFAYYDQTFEKDGGSEIEYLLGAIGQGNCAITPIGMNLCTNVILNGGVLREPRIIMAKSDSYDQQMERQSEEKKHEICDVKVAEQVAEMMLGVTSQGTGSSFYMPGFAAKTGTAQKADEMGNLTTKYTIWTTGGLTDETTPYSITVCLDDVEEEISSTAAGRIGKQVLEHIIGG